jgi:hypothetical protein
MAEFEAVLQQCWLISDVMTFHRRGFAGSAAAKSPASDAL